MAGEICPIINRECIFCYISDKTGPDVKYCGTTQPRKGSPKKKGTKLVTRIDEFYVPVCPNHYTKEI